MLFDDDQPPGPGGPRFRVFLPAFLKRLIERLRRWIGGA
jgi:hypothetical protein